MRSKFISSAPFIFFALVAAGYYWNQVTLQAIPFAAEPAGSDLLAVNLPYLSYSAERLRAGELPLWTSRVGGGFPQFAEGGTAFFYPFTLLLNLVFPPLKAALLLFPVHAFLAMLGMYLLCRALSVGRWGATLSAVTFALSGYFVGHLKHLNHLFMAASLLPFAVACAFKFYQTKRYSWAVGTGLILALMLLSGSAFVTYQTILLLTLLSLLYAGRELMQTFSSIWPEWRKKSKEAKGNRFSPRGLFEQVHHPSSEYLSGWRSGKLWKRIQNTIHKVKFQRRVGDGAEGMRVPQQENRVTLSGLLDLRVCAVRWLSFAAIVALTFFSLSAVQLMPSYELARHSSRAANDSPAWATTFPFHPKNLLTFIRPFAFGNPAFDSYEPSFEKIANEVGLFWENIGYIGLLPLALALIAIPIAVRRKRWDMGMFVIVLALGLTLALGKHSPIHEWFWRFVPGFSAFRVPGRYLLWSDLALAILAGYGFHVLLEWTKTKKNLIPTAWVHYLLAAAMIAATLFDLGVFGYYYNAMDRLDAARWSQMPQAASWLREQAGQYRYVSLFSGEDFNQNLRAAGGWHNDLAWVLDNRELLPPNYSLLYGIESFDHYTPLTLARTDAFRAAAMKNLLAKITFTKGDPAPNYHLRDQIVSLLSRANVKYFVAPVQLRHPYLKETAHLPFRSSEGFMWLYENDQVMPRAYLTTQATTVSTQAEASTRISESMSNDQAIIETAAPPNLAARQTRADIIGRGEGWYNIRTATDGTAFLVLNESYYPGWEARIDGAPAEIFPANIAFQGIVVPAGEHMVEFRFRPKTFRLGALISGAGWSLLIILSYRNFKV